MKPIVIIVILTLGAIFAVVTTTWAVTRRRKQRETRGDRPPQETPLLRPPGYSLMQRVDDQVEAVVEEFLKVAVAGACAALMGWSAIETLLRASGNPPAGEAGVNSAAGVYPALAISGTLFAGAVAFGLYQGRRIVRMAEQAGNLRLGLRGEQAVGEVLNDPAITGAGYRTFHDIPGDGDWNIDHVVVGPGGVYVIETKARTKRNGPGEQPKHEVIFDGETLRFPDWTDRTTLEQVQANARWLRRWLGEHVPKDLAIHQVVVIPGWYVRTLGRYETKVMNARYLAGFLAKEPRRFSKDSLNPVLQRLDERCRTLDF